MSKARTLLVLIAILILSGYTIAKLRRLFESRTRPGGTETIQSRLQQFAPPVAQRLAPDFQRAGIPYPPARLVLAAFKQERQLEVYAASQAGPLQLIRAYPIKAASGKLGPKLQEGDGQVPEGLYNIEYLNPNSLYHLSMKIDYPNAFDRLQSRRFPGARASTDSSGCASAAGMDQRTLPTNPCSGSELPGKWKS